MAAKKPAPREYDYAVMAIHPVHGKPMPVAVHPTETAATADAVARNQKSSHLAHHVKKVAKGMIPASLVVATIVTLWCVFCLRQTNRILNRTEADLTMVQRKLEEAHQAAKDLEATVRSMCDG